MPKTVIAARLTPTGPVLLAEVDSLDAAIEDDGYARASTRLEELAAASESVQEALDNVIKPAAQAVMERLKDLAPDRVELEMGLRLSGKAGLIFASTEGEAHLNVKLSWSPVSAATRAE
jgi:hypothetical protein